MPIFDGVIGLMGGHPTFWVMDASVAMYKLQHRPWKHGQTTDLIQSKLWSSHKTHLASDADMGFIVSMHLTKSSSFPEGLCEW